MLKKFVHNNIETCGITKKPIDTLKEKWCCILEFEADKRTSLAFYKSDYLKELLQGNKEKISAELLDRINESTHKLLAKALRPEVLKG